ncbi:MAG: hypothetical protein FWD58_03475 [Firmicutes bacterium]|nr:hypothetical protein [Bacillota bacterium]
MNNDNLMTASERNYWVTQLCKGARRGYTIEKTARKLKVDKALFSTWRSDERAVIFMAAKWRYCLRQAFDGNFNCMKQCVDYYIGTDAPLFGIDTMPTDKKAIRGLFWKHKKYIEQGIKECEDFAKRTV